jgi:hypothetical protein
MQGVPDHLNLPRIAYDDPDIHADVLKAQGLCGFTLGRLPGGFAAGIRVLGVFEQELLSARWGGNGYRDLTLEHAQAFSGLCSAKSGVAHAWKTPRQALRPLPASWLDYVDGLYDEPRGWAFGTWEIVLKGPHGSRREDLRNLEA